MKQEMHIKNLNELSFISGSSNEMRRKIGCVMIDYEDVATQFSSAVHLDAMIAILVLSGKGQVNINYKTYSVAADTLLLMSSSHLFRFDRCTSYFRGLCLLVSKEFIDETDSTDMIYRRTKYGVRLYNDPVIPLTHARAEVLYKRIMMIDDAIDNVGHFYQKEMILNNLFAFYLDLSDILEREAVSPSDGSLTRYESIIKSFIELLVAHYRQEHGVEFYASRLNLSAHYLTCIVKRVTGQSVSDFIFEMLFSEARTLLVHSKLSIQEIAAALNFSDQSSFGKFFKRKAGVSPVDFRKQR